MKEYIIKYKKSDGIKHDVHHSWYELCERQTKDEIINILKKHLYEPGEYILHFYAHKGAIRCRRKQDFFSGWIIGLDDKAEKGILTIGRVSFDYFDDTFDNYDFKSEWPEIDCEKAVSSNNATFAVSAEELGPSPKELKIISERYVERFINRLSKSVNFPLEIACDYPDVIFEICYDCNLDENLKSATLKIIEEYVSKYNKRHENAIHYVGYVSDLIDNKQSNAVNIHIDFGDCNIDALALVIKAIGKSDLPIKEITLK